MAHRTPSRRHDKIAVNEGLNGTMTAVSYTPLASTSFARWSEIGVTLGRMARSIQWWVGDWILFGEGKFGEEFAQALEATGRDPKTLLEWARVCKSVKENRRRSELSFAHHECVSTLDADDQRYWLQRAIEGDPLPNGEREVWSSRRLRAEINKGEQADEGPDVEVEVEDKGKVPLEYLVVDVQAVRQAYRSGTTMIAGLKLSPPAETALVKAPAPQKGKPRAKGKPKTKGKAA